jgi:hypothetical protein
MWELLRKRQQYQQVRKPKVADCGIDISGTDGGLEKQTSLPTPVMTIDSLRERLHLSFSPRRRPLRPAAPLTVAPSDKLDPKTVNGEVCLLTDSPYRILRVSDGNTWMAFLQVKHLHPLAFVLCRSFTQIHQTRRFDTHRSVHRRWLSRNTNKVQLCNRIYYSKVF